MEYIKTNNSLFDTRTKQAELKLIAELFLRIVRLIRRQNLGQLEVLDRT